jgi:hypothetical protein
MSATEAGVVVAHADISGFENLFRTAIEKELGDDRDALKAFQVAEYRPPDVEAAMAYHKLGKKLYTISGALGLNDSGDGWRAFDVTIEEGLTSVEDQQVADQLAFQCKKCVAQLKRQKKAVH